MEQSWHSLRLSMKTGSLNCWLDRGSLWWAHSSARFSISCCCSCLSTCCCQASGVRVELLCHPPWERESFRVLAQSSSFPLGGLGRSGHGSSPSWVDGRPLWDWSSCCQPKKTLCAIQLPNRVVIWYEFIRHEATFLLAKYTINVYRESVPVPLHFCQVECTSARQSCYQLSQTPRKKKNNKWRFLINWFSPTNASGQGFFQKPSDQVRFFRSNWQGRMWWRQEYNRYSAPINIQPASILISRHSHRKWKLCLQYAKQPNARLWEFAQWWPWWPISEKKTFFWDFIFSELKFQLLWKKALLSKVHLHLSKTVSM